MKLLCAAFLYCASAAFGAELSGKVHWVCTISNTMAGHEYLIKRADLRYYPIRFVDILYYAPTNNNTDAGVIDSASGIGQEEYWLVWRPCKQCLWIWAQGSGFETNSLPRYTSFTTHQRFIVILNPATNYLYDVTVHDELGSTPLLSLFQASRGSNGLPEVCCGELRYAVDSNSVGALAAVLA